MTGAAFLSPLALDFLWESACAGEVPYPLEVRSHGATLDERGALRRQVLAAPVEPHGEEWLALLAGAERGVDARVPDRPGEPADRRAGRRHGRAGAAGHAGRPGACGCGRSTRPRWCPRSSACSRPRRGGEPSVTVAAEDLAAGGRTAAERRALAAFAKQRDRHAGQFAITVRGPMGGRVRSSVLSWFDTDPGRYLTYTSRGRDRREWVAIAPADPATLRHRLTESMAGVG